MTDQDDARIDMAVEPLVREAFASAIGRSPARCISALQAMIDGGNIVIRDSANLAGAICAVALLDLFAGRQPTDGEIGQLAEQLVAMETWSEIDVETAVLMLKAVAGIDVRSTLPNDTYIQMIFVVGAWLLASFGPADLPWYKGMDEILTRIENEQTT